MLLDVRVTAPVGVTGVDGTTDSRAGPVRVTADRRHTTMMLAIRDNARTFITDPAALRIDGARIVTADLNYDNAIRKNGAKSPAELS